MLGSVWYQVTLRGARRPWLHWLRWAYGLWLLVVFYFIFSPPLTIRLEVDPKNPQQTVTAIRMVIEGEWVLASCHFIAFWLWQQYLLLFLVCVPYVAGEITDEKMSGTLQFVFTTQVNSGQIIVGKLLGRGLQMLGLLLVGVPIYCFASAWVGFTPTYLLAQLLLLVLWVYALSGAALLASVWCRNSQSAILGMYTVVLLAAVGLVNLQSGLNNLIKSSPPPQVATVAEGVLNCLNPLLRCLDPLALVPEDWSNLDRVAVPPRFPMAALVYGGLGSLFLTLAVWRLRPAFQKQLEQAGTAGEGWTARRHPSMTEQPVAWKEQYAVGLGPPIVRKLPRWVELLLVALVAVGVSVWFGAGAGLGSIGWQITREIAYTAFMIPVAVILVGVRSAGLITSEYERETWDTLRLTPLTIGEIVRQKYRGVHRAGSVWLLAYGVPALLLAATTGLASCLWMAVRLVQIWIVIRMAAALGLNLSSRSRSTWRALLGTIFFGNLLALAMCLLGTGFIAGGLVRLHERWQDQDWHTWLPLVAVLGIGIGITGLLEWCARVWLYQTLRWLGGEWGE